MKRLAIAATLAAALVLSVAAPATAATGSHNWLARDCSAVVAHPAVRDCVYGNVDLDGKHVIVFRDHHGKRHTVNRRHWLTTVAKQHSHRCATHGDPHGCWFVDEIEGMSVVLPDGTTVATRWLKK